MERNVYVSRRFSDVVMERLGEVCNYEVNPEPRPATREELLAGVKGRDAVVCLLNDRIDAEVFDAAGPQCRLFANYGVGYNNIDVAEAERRGIIITNTPDVLNDATADMAWALLFATARRVVEGDGIVRHGTFSWQPEFLLGRDITGSTLGILGAGRIGRNFARKAKGFDMEVLYAGRRPSPDFEAETGGKFVPMDELLQRSDFISLHVPLTPETRHLIGERELSLMKPTAVLINTARGPVVDEKALAKALQSRKIWGAGLDVYEKEPEVEPLLLELDNVVLAPHIGSATVDTRNKMGWIVADNLEAYFSGKEPPTRVRA